MRNIKRYYFLTNPEDVDLFLKETNYDQTDNIDSFLIHPLYCGKTTEDNLKARYALYIYLRKAELEIQRKETVKDRIALYLKASQMMLNIDSMGITYEDKLINALQKLRLIRYHYGDLTVKYIEPKNVITFFEDPTFYERQYKKDLKEMVGHYITIADGGNDIYLTENGITHGSWALFIDYKLKGEDTGIEFLRRTVDQLTKAEQKGAVMLDKNSLYVFTNNQNYSEVPLDSPIKQYLKEHLPLLENADNLKIENYESVEESLPSDFVEGCIEQITKDRMTNALENKWLICNEVTLKRDYGWRYINTNMIYAELDKKRNLQEINKGCYYMAKALGIPFNSIGCHKIGLSIKPPQKSTRDGQALAYFSTKDQEIVLYNEIGEGSLAHEWGHALDCLCGEAVFPHDLWQRIRYMTSPAHIPAKYRKQCMRIPDFEEAFNKGLAFVKALTKDENGKSLPFFRESGHTWAPKYHKTPTEVLARSLSKVVNMKMKEEGIYKSICFSKDEAVSYVPSDKEAKYLEPVIMKFIQFTTNYYQKN